MRKACLLVCCVLIVIAMMMISVDARSAEKGNIKPKKKDLSKDKSNKSDSEDKSVPAKTPERKAQTTKKERKKQEKKIKKHSINIPKIPNDSTEIPKIQDDSTQIPNLQNDLIEISNIENDSIEIPNLQNDSTEIPNLQNDSIDTPNTENDSIEIPNLQNDSIDTPNTENNSIETPNIQKDSSEIPVITAQRFDIDLPQLFEPAEVKEPLQTTLAAPENCSATVNKSDKLEQIEKNVTSLWRHLRVVSQPVHVHIHGGHASSLGCHGNDGRQADHSHKGHHHQHKDRHQLADKHKCHGWSDTDNHSHAQSHGHARNRSRDHSHSHSHDKSHSHSLDDSHSDSHSHSHNKTTSHKHHTVGSNNRTHHRHGDRSHKSHDHYKHHGHMRKSARGYDHSPSKGHYHKGGYGYRDHSTHVHIHLTIDGNLPPVHRDVNQSESASSVPITNDTQTDTHAHTPEQLFARCDFQTNNRNHNLNGYVLLRQNSGVLGVAVNISGFRVTDADHPGPRTHGFHVHEFGDLSNGCLSFGSHYNPEGVTHGGLHNLTRHVGDWGNIEVNDQGEAVTYFDVSDAALHGPHSILGRGIVVHELADDLGEGGVPASKTTGNAGGRLACCIIGLSKPLPAEFFQQPTIDPADSTPETQLTP